MIDMPLINFFKCVFNHIYNCFFTFRQYIQDTVSFQKDQSLLNFVSNKMLYLSDLPLLL
jgi:hypothetical protein